MGELLQQRTRVWTRVWTRVRRGVLFVSNAFKKNDRKKHSLTPIIPVLTTINMKHTGTTPLPYGPLGMLPDLEYVLM